MVFRCFLGVGGVFLGLFGGFPSVWMGVGVVFWKRF